MATAFIEDCESLTICTTSTFVSASTVYGLRKLSQWCGHVANAGKHLRDLYVNAGDRLLPPPEKYAQGVVPEGLPTHVSLTPQKSKTQSSDDKGPSSGRQGGSTPRPPNDASERGTGEGRRTRSTPESSQARGTAPSGGKRACDSGIQGSLTGSSDAVDCAESLFCVTLSICDEARSSADTTCAVAAPLRGGWRERLFEAAVDAAGVSEQARRKVFQVGAIW
eukprot:Opistho-2@7993